VEGHPRFLDLGSGTGHFSSALADWFDVEVIAVEPSAEMRAKARQKSTDGRVVHVGGAGEGIPLRRACCDVAWLSTVIHHIPDLGSCARELRRVLTDDGVVLIRSAFPGRLDGITLFRFFPAARRVIDTFPTLEATNDAFEAAGFEQVALEAVPQVSAPSLAEACARVRLRADTTLQGISDAEFAAGISDLERAVAAGDVQAPIVDYLDLLVFRPAA
jgi:SAM-dependent methyltransferase